MTVRLLLDLNLSPRWVEALAVHGVTATHWSAIGALTAKDEDIMAWARDHGYTVFTHDLDFGSMLALTGASGPSVIQVRGHDVLPSDRLVSAVVAAVQKYSEELQAGVLMVLDRQRLRLRILPLTP